MTLLLAALAGALAARLGWLLLRPTFAQPVFARENWRGRAVPTAAGVVVAVAVVVVEAGRVVAGAAGVGEEGLSGPRLVVLAAVAGFSLLGALDDLAGGADARGFRGHLAALARGRLTTGGLKLAGGAALALVVVAPVSAGAGPGRLVADAALVALAANLANLLDRAPGRTLKCGTGAFAALALATGADPALAGVAVAAGAGLGLLPDDLAERLMLGDAGANALGAALGLGVVLACAPATRTWALVAVAALNLASEAVSFSRVIAAVPPLRALDAWGRRS